MSNTHLVVQAIVVSVIVFLITVTAITYFYETQPTCVTDPVLGSPRLSTTYLNTYCD
jgi:hypothetical protein